MCWLVGATRELCSTCRRFEDFCLDTSLRHSVTLALLVDVGYQNGCLLRLQFRLPHAVNRCSIHFSKIGFVKIRPQKVRHVIAKALNSADQI